MPDKEFLEGYPLYRRFPLNVRPPIAKPPINMHCPICDQVQTFNGPELLQWERDYSGFVVSVGTFPGSGDAFSQFQKRDFTEAVTYKCAACGQGKVSFYLMFSPSSSTVQKAGQFPPWSIALDRNLERALGTHTALYRKGLVCESQGYGIGAFSYYRRTLEGVITKLIEDVAELVDISEREHYSAALEKVRSLHTAEDKINLVKDLLPSSLRPSGINPLGVLYESLSEGLHSEDDEKCLELAGHIRTGLEYLVDQVSRGRAASARFTEGMQRLLDRHKGQPPGKKAG